MTKAWFSSMRHRHIPDCMTSSTVDADTTHRNSIIYGGREWEAKGTQLTPLCGLGQHGWVVSGRVARRQCPRFCLHLLPTPGPADSVQTSRRVFWEAGLSPHAAPFLHCLDCSFPCWFKRQQASSHFPSFRSWLKFCTSGEPTPAPFPTLEIILVSWKFL